MAQKHKTEIVKREDPRETSFTTEIERIQIEFEPILNEAIVGISTSWQFSVNNQKEADLAGKSINEIAAVRQRWKANWSKDITNATAVLSSLRNRWGKGDKLLGAWELGLRSAANKWRLEEVSKREERAKEVNEQQDDVVYQAPKVEIAGMKSVDRKKHEVYWCDGEKCLCKGVDDKLSSQEKADYIKGLHSTQGLIKLAKAVGSGKVPPDAIEPADKYLGSETVRMYDKAQIINGERYIFPGVRCYIDSGLSR